MTNYEGSLNHITLLPCPFCGGTKLWQADPHDNPGGETWVTCETCKSSCGSVSGASPEDSTPVWNRRPGVSSEIPVSKREAELESCLIDCIQILNSIRARDGTYGDYAIMYFNSVVEQGHKLLGGDSLVAMWKRDAATREPVSLAVGSKAIKDSLLSDGARYGDVHLPDARAVAKAWGLNYVD